MRSLTFDAQVEFFIRRDLTKNDTTVHRIMSLYKRLFLPGLSVSCTIYTDYFTRIFVLKAWRARHDRIFDE